MKKIIRKAGALVFGLALLASLASCEKSGPQTCHCVTKYLGEVVSTEDVDITEGKCSDLDAWVSLVESGIICTSK